MDLNELRQLVAWVEASDLRCLELTSPEGHITLTRSESDPFVVDTTEGPESRAEPVGNDEGAAETVFTETAGLFVSAHPMRDRPFAVIGDSVTRNDVLGLLQIKHIYAPIRAPIDGVVTAILATEGALLGFGTPVFRITPAPSDVAGI
jgi:acetyl-CoA carboxylase biotin carboxyl carrier protein